MECQPNFGWGFGGFWGGFLANHSSPKQIPPKEEEAVGLFMGFVRGFSLTITPRPRGKRRRKRTPTIELGAIIPCRSVPSGGGQGAMGA